MDRTQHTPDMPANTALVIIDVQQTFDNQHYWGTRNNPKAEQNIEKLARFWKLHNMPMVMVTHTSDRLESTFHPHHDSSKLKPFLTEFQPALEVSKTVNSAFYGTPDLSSWLKSKRIEHVVLCGIQTNMCVETTARMSGNLGFKTTVASDACHTFGLVDLTGEVIDANLLTRVSAANLSRGDFAQIALSEVIIAGFESH